MDNHTPLTITAGDMRRAAALIVHCGRNDSDGMNAVVAEAIDEKRALNLTFALLHLNHEIVPLLYTSEGLALMSNHVTRLAGLESEAQ